MEKNFNNEIYGVLERLGQRILAIYRAQAPRDTGALTSSIKYRINETANGYSLGFYYLKYGVYVNLGTYDNKDTSAYGLSDFDLPPYNARPKKGVTKGIAPRYWTSLKGEEDSIKDEIDKEVKDILGVTTDDILKMFEGTQTTINP
jgi:hypothetical protein